MLRTCRFVELVQLNPKLHYVFILKTSVTLLLLRQAPSVPPTVQHALQGPTPTRPVCLIQSHDKRVIFLCVLVIEFEG